MKGAAAVLACVAGLCACASTERTARVDTVFGSYNPNAADGRAGFAHMKQLVGAWEATRDDGKKMRASYKEISGGSVLMETYTTPSGKETMTAYHPDGRRLMLTHYCAQGNQPRLQAIVVTEHFIKFSYIDASNLTDAQDLLATLTITFKDEGTLERTETYRLASGGTETTVLVFRRENAGS